MQKILKIVGLCGFSLWCIRLGEALESARGQQLWSGEIWYTLNDIP